MLEAASGAPPLTLDVLGRYVDERRAKKSDYLAAPADRLDDARELQADERR